MSNAGLRFGDSATIKGDVVGGDKYDIRFFVLASSNNETMDWSRYRTSETPILDPYKFLSYYETTDADIFYGRETVSGLLVSKITAHRLVLINGRSGSGKTSLVNAGIVPRLVEMGYFVMVFKDYGYPTELIKTGIQELPNISVDLDGCSSLHDILNRTFQATGRPLAIFLDQFERFFTGLSIDDRNRFILEFKACNELDPRSVRFVFSIREDFYGKLGEFWKLVPELNTTSYQFYLEPLSLGEARDAIRKPLNRLPWKISYDPSFLDEVLLPQLVRSDGTTGPSVAQPAHLQIICNRLYEEARKEYAAKIREQEPVTIGRELYDRLGGAEGILEGYLDEILSREYSGEERLRVQSVLKRMASAQGTRLFVTSTALREAAGIPETEVQRILARLESDRLIEVVRGEDKYTLAHEYLVDKINGWYDPIEMELKRATELFNRSLQDFRARGYLIPFTVFRDVKKFNAQISMDAAGRNLYRRSATRFYGFWSVIGAVALALAAFAGNQSYHLFYLVPNQIGRVKVVSEGAGGDVSTTIVQIAGAAKDNVQGPASAPASFKLKRGMYYVEAKSGPYLAKIPVFMDGYGSYADPIVVAVPSPPSSAEIDKMVYIPAGAFLLDSPRFRIGAETMAKVEAQGIDGDLSGFKALAERAAAREWETGIFLDALAAAIGPERAARVSEAILKAMEPPSDKESLQRRTVPVDGFYVDKYEVSNRDYADFLAAGSDHRLHYSAEPPYKRDSGHEPKYWGKGFYKQYSPDEDSPVVNVDWYDAFAYCAFKGKRLPTDWEWEKAAGWQENQASPGDSRKLLFPWGNVFGDERANTGERWRNSWELRRTMPVTSNPDGASPYGVFNLAGNVFEWTDSWYAAGNPREQDANGPPRTQALRGGSFAHPQDDARTYTVLPPENLESTDVQFGFRCAVSASAP